MRYCGNNPVIFSDAYGLCGSQSSGWNRTLGGLKAIGGVFETTAGVGLSTASAAFGALN